MAKEIESGDLDIRAPGARIKLPLKWLGIVLALLGLPATGTFVGTQFCKSPEAIAGADTKNTRPLVETGPVIARLHDDDARQRMDIDGISQRQQQDHDALIKLQADMQHIKENTDKAVRLLERHVEKP